MSEKAIDSYRNPDNDPRGPWKSDPATAQAGHGTKSQFYVFTAPNGKRHEPESGRCWLFTKDVFEKAARDGRIWFGKDGNGVPRIKTYLESKERGLTPETIWFAADASTNETAKANLKELFDGIAVFDTPKPVPLVDLMLQLSADDGIVLDFFSGSCVVAEAVLKRGKNTFVCVQLPEQCEPASEAHRVGYKTIADIGKERIRRVIKKLNDEDAGKLDLAGKAKQDRGFKVFKLAESSFVPWKSQVAQGDTSALEKQLALHINHLRDGRTSYDILHEILLKSGFELTTSIKKLILAGKTVHSIAAGGLLICLEDKLTLELIRAMADLKPQRVVCLDKGFANNDQLKTNAAQIFKTKGVTAFKTV